MNNGSSSSAMSGQPNLHSSSMTMGMSGGGGGGPLDKQQQHLLRRAAKACDTCHKRKIKCDGEQPCATCSKGNLRCTFDAIVRRRIHRNGYMEALEHRIIELSRIVVSKGESLPPVPKALAGEDFGHTLLELFGGKSPDEGSFLSNSNDEVSTLRSLSGASLLPTEQVQTGNGLAQLLNAPSATSYHHRSTPGESTIPRTSSRSPFTLGAAVGNRVAATSMLSSTQKRPRVDDEGVSENSSVPKNAATLQLELRDEQLCAVNLGIVQYFFETLHNVLPLFHHQTFLRQLIPENQHSSLLLMSMYSLALHTALAYGDLTHMNLTQESVDTICSTAIRLVPRYLDEPTLSTVQACMILSFLCYAKDNLALSWLLHGIAMRFAIRLGLNKDISEESNLTRPFVELELRRRAWWMAFNVDRLASTRPQRPMMLDEREMNQVLPAPESYFQNIDGNRIVPFSQRLLEQRVPFHDIFHYLQDKRFSLDGFSYEVLLFQCYGRTLQFVRNAGTSKFSLDYLDNNILRTEIHHNLRIITKSAPASLRNWRVLTGGRTPSEYACFNFVIHVNFCELLLRCPIISTMEVDRAAKIQEYLFTGAVSNAETIMQVARKISEVNPSLKCYSPVFSVAFFYSALIFMAAIIDQPSSPLVPQYLESLDLLVISIKNLLKIWGSLARYDSCISIMRARYGLETSAKDGAEMNSPDSMSRIYDMLTTDPFPILFDNVPDIGYFVDANMPIATGPTTLATGPATATNPIAVAHNHTVSTDISSRSFFASSSSIPVTTMPSNAIPSYTLSQGLPPIIPAATIPLPQSFHHRDPAQQPQPQVPAPQQRI